jgi:hypothetical protein
MMWSDEVVGSISHAFRCETTLADTLVLDTSLFAIGTEALPQWKQWSALFEPPCGPAFKILQIAVATPNAPSPQRKVETLLNAMRALSPAAKGRFDGAMRELFADSDNDEAHGATEVASRLWATQVIHESMKYRCVDETARRTKAQDGASVWHCIPVGAHAAKHARGLRLSVGKVHDDITARAPHYHVDESQHSQVPSVAQSAANDFDVMWNIAAAVFGDQGVVARHAETQRELAYLTLTTKRSIPNSKRGHSDTPPLFADRDRARPTKASTRVCATPPQLDHEEESNVPGSNVAESVGQTDNSQSQQAMDVTSPQAQLPRPTAPAVRLRSEAFSIPQRASRLWLITDTDAPEMPSVAVTLSYELFANTAPGAAANAPPLSVLPVYRDQQDGRVSDHAGVCVLRKGVIDA